MEQLLPGFGNSHSRVSTPPVFVVGTGRCGSTMISTLLNGHPAILSLSEFFVMISDMAKELPGLFSQNIIDHESFWSLLSKPGPFLRNTLNNNIVSSEFLYLSRPERRFTVRTEIPPILLIALSLIATDPDALYEDIERFVATLPPAFPQTHFQRLFLWLQNKLDRKVVVERSAGSIQYVSLFNTAFPGAKFVHIVRDGRDCAVSMSHHVNFRLVYVQAQLRSMLGYNPFESQERTGIEHLSQEFQALLPEQFDHEIFQRLDVPASFFGHLWSTQIIPGCSVLKTLPAEQVFLLKYEDVLREPHISLAKLLNFIDPELTDEAWLQASSAQVRPARSTWQTLPAQEREAVEVACRPGFAALAGLY